MTPEAAASDAPGSVEAKGRTILGEGSLVGDRYLLERLLGEGGMGAVYQGVHVHMRKRVAVKLLHPELDGNAEIVARFEREAMASANIDHPNVAAATDFGKLADGGFYLVLEYVDGESLTKRLARSPLPLATAIHIARQITQALIKAHALGIVHRDIKPDNVMLTERDGDDTFVKVLDFGIAKLPVDAELGKGQSAGATGRSITRSGMIYGTPEYLSPEQALGGDVTAQADLYSFGVLLYEMIAGKLPFESTMNFELLRSHIATPAPPLPCADTIPKGLADLVAQCLDKNPSARPESAAAVLETLEAVRAEVARSEQDQPLGERPIAIEDASPNRVAAPSERASWTPAKKGALVGLALVVLGGGWLAVRAATPAKKADPMALADVDRAQQFAAAGDTLKALSELEKGPFAPIDRDRGYRLLVALETTSGEGGKAMRDATLAAQEVPGLAADPTFIGSLVPLASGAQGATLLDFLLAHPTSASMDALYKISLMPTGTANSAWKLLSAGSLEPSMSAPLRIAVFLRKMGPSCKVKETVIEAAAQGDGRSLPFLERLLPSRSASAPLLKRIFGGGKRDPLACLHATTIVQDAITQIKARGQ